MFGVDRNYPWAIGEYERLARTDGRASILTRPRHVVLPARPEAEPDDRAPKTQHGDARLTRQTGRPIENLTFIYLATGRTKDAIEAGEKGIEAQRNGCQHLQQSRLDLCDIQRIRRFATSTSARRKKAGRANQGRAVEFFSTLLPRSTSGRAITERALTTLRKAQGRGRRSRRRNSRDRSGTSRSYGQTIPCGRKTRRVNMMSRWADLFLYSAR